MSRLLESSLRITVSVILGGFFEVIGGVSELEPSSMDSLEPSNLGLVEASSSVMVTLEVWFGFEIWSNVFFKFLYWSSIFFLC